MKKYTFHLLLLVFIGVTKHSPAQMILGAKISPNFCFAFVQDSDYNFDGQTENEGNRNGFGLGLTVDLPLNEQYYFGTGLSATQKNIHIRNSVIGYSGTSKYNLSYFQVPALIKYRTGEVFTKKLNLVFGAGVMADFKIRELVQGNDDGAHFKNMADNNTVKDPFRGQNGNNKKVPLFAPVNLGLVLQAGAEYPLMDKLAVCAGFTINPTFFNLINPKLTYDNIANTPLVQDLRIMTSLVSFDIGVVLK